MNLDLRIKYYIIPSSFKFFCIIIIMYRKLLLLPKKERTSFLKNKKIPINYINIIFFFLKMEEDNNECI
jgi:hypothetical protein